MSDENSVVVQRQGIGFCGVLFIVFFILKLGVGSTAVMGWSWWWVTAPLWGGIAIGLSVVAIIFIMLLMGWLFSILFTAIGNQIDKKSKK